MSRSGDLVMELDGQEVARVPMCDVRRCEKVADWFVKANGRVEFSAYYCDEHVDLSNRLPVAGQTAPPFVMTVARMNVLGMTL